MTRRDWSSYDGIEDAYDAISVPHYFRWPAQQLVSLLAICPTDRVLDVGAGTGVVTELVRRIASHVLAVDLSWSMLSRAKARFVGDAVVSRLPSLPFPRDSFDCLTASFVLSHLSRPEEALTELSRVLRPPGRLGITSWAISPSDNEIGRVWTDTAHRFVSEAVLSEELSRALPGEQRLADPHRLEELLSSAGFCVRRPQQLDFPVSVSTQDYLASRSLAMAARFMRSILSPEAWREFERMAAARVLERFGRNLTFTVRANFAVAAAARAGRSTGSR